MSPSSHRKQLAAQRARRAAFKARGLRCDGKPLAPRKPCGCLGPGYCYRCCRAKKFTAFNRVVLAMHADYLAGMSTGAISRKYPGRKGRPRNPSEIKRFFKTRGLKLLPVPKQCLHQIGNPGRFQAKPRKTSRQITALIKRLKRLSVPSELNYEWREWSMSKRIAFIKRCRKKFPSTIPTGPYSKNVVPFKYGSPAAQTIEARMNAGRNSRHKLIKIKPTGEGVIYQDELYFWSNKTGYNKGTKWTPEHGRPLLHHVIWQQHHGPIPPGHTVIFQDGNHNNLHPSNLALRTRERCALQNHWKHRPRKVRENIFFKISTTRAATMAAKSRSQVSILLNQTKLFNRFKINPHHKS